MIYHIYWGTAGNAGLYLDEIYQSLHKAGFKQKVFVSYYYPFEYGEKVFFKKTEMEHSKYKGFVRKIMQAVELVVALFNIFICAKKDKPNVINYSYVSRGNSLILYFLQCIKKVSGCRLVITCHDVIPIIENKDEYEKEISIKRKIYALADYYLVHTDSSRRELQNLFPVTDKQVLIHLFPLMDLSKMDKTAENEETKYDFLFIGHMRQEKGVPILIDAWKKFHEIYPCSRLCIAGNPYFYKDYIEERIDLCNSQNIDLNLGFIKDDDYIRIVKESRCVVFPYTGGTNSGVISTVMSLGKDVITSDIGMFVSSSFVPRENMFKAGDSNSLFEMMIAYMKGLLVSDSRKRIAGYRTMFDEQVERVYKQIANKSDLIEGHD